MKFITLFGIFGVGTILFLFLNKVMNITYIGSNSMFATWFGCAIAGMIIAVFLAGFITTIIGVILKIGMIIALIAGIIYAISKIKNKKSLEEK